MFVLFSMCVFMGASGCTCLSEDFSPTFDPDPFAQLSDIRRGHSPWTIEDLIVIIGEDVAFGSAFHDGDQTGESDPATQLQHSLLAEQIAIQDDPIVQNDRRRPRRETCKGDGPARGESKGGRK